MGGGSVEDDDVDVALRALRPQCFDVRSIAAAPARRARCRESAAARGRGWPAPEPRRPSASADRPRSTTRVAPRAECATCSRTSGRARRAAQVLQKQPRPTADLAARRRHAEHACAFSRGSTSKHQRPPPRRGERRRHATATVVFPTPPLPVTTSNSGSRASRSALPSAAVLTTARAAGGAAGPHGGRFVSVERPPRRGAGVRRARAHLSAFTKRAPVPRRRPRGATAR